MKKLNKTIGNFGEDLAEKFLIDWGYTIIERNFKCKIGELDIIGKDDEHIAFIEVKTRYDSLYGAPSEAVTAYKQFKIYKTAQYYIMMRKLYKLNFRFDVVEIMLNKFDNCHKIRLIKNAFQI
ncbi:YraN family protein [Clostridium swellfunianum]|uniref:YraN family protein n=1 Tax=Clostridium swellfunianum TaxID=1367462 RepID=UPI00202FC507|nr:YraN family protein [Clostridium swellfunianum]MCM0648689.1 YraN family protein [Clostridium swellfunianum]